MPPPQLVSKHIRRMEAVYVKRTTKGAESDTSGRQWCFIAPQKDWRTRCKKKRIRVVSTNMLLADQCRIYFLSWVHMVTLSGTKQKAKESVFYHLILPLVINNFIFPVCPIPVSFFPLPGCIWVNRVHVAIGYPRLDACMSYCLGASL